MVQTIVISVSISCVISALFTFFMIYKSSKALGQQITRDLSKQPKNIK